LIRPHWPHFCGKVHYTLCGGKTQIEIYDAVRRVKAPAGAGAQSVKNPVF
jgi:hypothetical protein